MSLAQTLAPADAGDFMGTWTMSMEGPQGPFEQELELKDKDGKVVGELTNAVMPMQVITDITKTGRRPRDEVRGQLSGQCVRGDA